MGERSPTMLSRRGVEPATAHNTLRVAILPRLVMTPVTAGPDPLSSRLDGDHFRILMDLDAAPVGAAPITPGYGVMTRYGPGSVIERAHHGRVAAAGDVHHRERCAHCPGIDRFAFDAKVFVDFSTPAHGAQGGVGVGQGKMAARRIKQVEIEIGRQVLPQPDALIVEPHPLGGEVVGADDGGVTGGVTTAEVALLQYGDVAYSMVARQVVRGGQAMPATADDHDVVARLQPLVPREHPTFRMLARQGEF